MAGRDVNSLGKVFVAGHNGMVGSALVRALQAKNISPLIADRKSIDLTRQQVTEDWLLEHKPDTVFLAAAKVGGIHANANQPADFGYINQSIQTNVIHGAYKAGVKKLVFLGSACMYPRDCIQPMSTSSLFGGALEPTNISYAVAKLSGMQLCADYRRQYGVDFSTVIPTNSFGPNDNFDLKTSHVPAALMRRLHEAKDNGDKSLAVWGTGAPTRDFMHVDDMASAILHVATDYDGTQPINIGTNKEVSIRELSETLKDIIGFEGELVFDTSKPDGAPRKCLDCAPLRELGWAAKHTLKSGLEDAYHWFANDWQGDKA